MTSDTTEDLRIGPEILKQQAELYRRLRNTLRWVLGSLDGFSETERVAFEEMPELERWVLHRLTEIDAKIRAAVESYDWTGVYPDLHNFCSVDLSAFYFDIRKDALYCDRPDSLRRRAARTVLDHLHRCLCTWLAPVLCFTAEEAWGARFGEDTSVHLELFPALPAAWHDDALAAKWETIRSIRRRITVPIEESRKTNEIGSSLQAAVELPLNADHENFTGCSRMDRDRDRLLRTDRAGHGRDPVEGHARLRRQMRPLLESPDGSGNERVPPRAVPALRGRGGVGPGVQAGGMTRPDLHSAGTDRRADRPGGGPGEQVVGAARARPAGAAAGRAAAGAEPDDGVEHAG